MDLEIRDVAWKVISKPLIQYLPIEFAKDVICKIIETVLQKSVLDPYLGNEKYFSEV